VSYLQQARPGERLLSVPSQPEPLILGISAVQRRFESGCDEFLRALSDSDEAADAVDFTGKLHELSLAAGRVQAFAEALTLLTGDQTWNERAREMLRAYLTSDE